MPTDEALRLSDAHEAKFLAALPQEELGMKNVEIALLVVQKRHQVQRRDLENEFISLIIAISCRSIRRKKFASAQSQLLKEIIFAFTSRISTNRIESCEL